MKTLLNIDHNWSGTSAGREKTLEDNCLFGIGSRVRVIDELPGEMCYFSTEGKVGTVIGRDLTGRCGYGYDAEYVLYLDGIGESAWYPENTLSVLI